MQGLGDSSCWRRFPSAVPRMRPYHPGRQEHGGKKHPPAEEKRGEYITDRRRTSIAAMGAAPSSVTVKRKYRTGTGRVDLSFYGNILSHHNLGKYLPYGLSDQKISVDIPSRS